MSLKKWFQNMFSHPVLIEAPSNMFDEPSGDGPELLSPDSKGQVKLGLIVGHMASAKGAIMYNGMTEYEFNTEVAKKCAAYAAKNYPNMVVSIIYRDGIGINGAYLEARKQLCDAVIELHFNAFDGQTTGTETLCTADVSDVAFAHTIHKKVCGALGRKTDSRGVKCISKSVQGGGNVHAFPGGVNCLVEPFFGDNLEDAKLGLRSQDVYVECLIDGVALWARQTDLIR